MTTLIDQTTLSLTEAAELLHLAPQTIRRRIKRGEMPGQLVNGPRGPEYRIPGAAVGSVNHGSPDQGFPDQPSQPTQAYAAPDQGSPAEPSPSLRGVPGDYAEHRNLDYACPDNEPLNAPRHAMSPDAATVARQAEEIAFLRAQLERRAEEAARQAEAERELRLMMMQLERTNAELAASLCVKALPPAPEPEPPQKVRWWVRLWGGR